MNHNELQTAIEQKMSTREIAKQLNIGQTTVRHWLKKFGLKTSPTNGGTFEEDGKLYKVCPKCTRKLEVTSDTFYFRGRNVTYAWCKQCCNLNSYQRQKSLKERAVAYKGGKCSICGYNRYIGALDFHHLDPTKKDFGIANVATCSWEKIQPELDKTVLVCRNCHAEIHGKMVLPRGVEPRSTG